MTLLRMGNTAHARTHYQAGVESLASFSTPDLRQLRVEAEKTLELDKRR